MECDERSIPRYIPGFEVIRPLGRGGMGLVVLARQVSLDRLVAIKFLAPALEAAAQPAVRLRREAELMAKIKHPNIVSIYDLGHVDDRTYLVMEYVDGPDLRRSLDQGHPPPVALVRPLVRPLASALDCLHRNGILHRDLKPENILLERGANPKVTDFGIAVEGSRIGSLTGESQWVGTIGYVAPEVQYRLKVDERADQYSLAAVMYELLTGQKPLGVFKPPSRLNTRLSPRVDAVLLRALQEDREDRYPTIVEFGRELDRALGLPPAPSRRRLLALAALGLALLGGAVVLAWPGRRGPGRPGVARAGAGPAPRITNSLGMTLVLIPAGAFLMGSIDTDPMAARDERPQHRVRFARPFYLGAHEVTVRQYRAFVVATGYRTEAEAGGAGGFVYDRERGEIRQDPSFTWRHPDDRAGPADDEPVVQVTWNDATAFCDWLTRREGRSYRLPTEAEWEYACRAGRTTRWSSGDDPASLDAYAWTVRNAGGIPHPVGRKRPNAFGLHDMHGNVWEWCLDGYGPYPAEGVVDGSAAAGGRERVLRGGSWDWDDLARTRAAARLDSRPDYADFTYGFRVCAPATR